MKIAKIRGTEEQKSRGLKVKRQEEVIT